MKRILPITILLLLLCSPVWGADYYLRGTGGSDSNNGTSHAQGWLTLPYAITQMNGKTAGDDLYIQCGETFTLTASPSYWTLDGVDANNYSVIGAYYDDGATHIGVSGNRPIINRNSSTGFCIKLDGADYVNITNLDLRSGERSLMLATSTHAYIENCYLGWNASFGGVQFNPNCHHGMILYCTLDDNLAASGVESNDGIGIWYSDYVTVKYCKFKGWQHSQITISYSNYATIAFNYGDGSPEAVPLNAYNFIGVGAGSHHCEIYGNYLDNFNYPQGIGTGAYENDYYNNIHNITRTGKVDQGEQFMLNSATSSAGYGDTHNNDIYNNTFYYSEDDYTFRLLTSGQEDYNIVRDNRFYNNIMLEWDNGAFKIPSGIYGGAGIYQNTFANNIMYDAGGFTAHYQGTVYTVLATLETAMSSYASGNIASDPGLADPANEQFWPDAAGDAVVDAGSTTLYASWGIKQGETKAEWTNGCGVDGTFDLLTVSRDDYGGPDIGAYEYITGDPGPGPGSDFGNLTFMWDCEAADFTATSGAANYSITDKTGELLNGCTIAAAGHHTGGTVEGSKGIVADGASRNVRFADTVRSIWDGDASFKVGMWCKWPALTDSAQIFYAYEDANNHFSVYNANTDELRVKWRIDSTNHVYETTSGLNLSTGIWYYVVIETDPTDNHLAIYVNDTRWINYTGSNMSGNNLVPVNIRFGDYGGTASASVLIDDIKVSTSLADDLYAWRNNTDYTNDGGSSAPTITDIVIINDIDGTPSITTNPTATWSDSTDRYIGLKISEQLVNTGNPDLARNELDAGPTATDYTWIYYDRQLQIGANWYIAIKYTPQLGDRSTDLSFASISAFVLNTATLEDGDGNALVMTLPRADIGGTGTITLAYPGTINIGTVKISDFVSQLNTDIYRYILPVTDNVTITADNVLITGIGRTQVNTGTLTFTGDNNHVRCVNFSGAITYTGTGNTYHPICTRSSLKMGMGLQ